MSNRTARRAGGGRPQRTTASHEIRPSRSQRLLLNRTADLPDTFRQAILQKRVRLSDVTEYVTKHINDTSLTDLIDANTREQVGISTLTGMQLSNNKAMVVERIKLNFPMTQLLTLTSGSLPPLSSPEILIYTQFANSAATLLGQAISAGEFTLLLNGTVVFNCQIDRLLRDSFANGLSTKEDGFLLATPIFISAGTEIKAEIRLPQGLNLANITGMTTSHPVRACRLQLIGQGLRVVSSVVS